MAAVSVDEALATLLTLSQTDEQPNIQGAGLALMYGGGYKRSPVDFAEVFAFNLSLEEDTTAINKLESLLAEGKEKVASLYCYRSCVRAFPQAAPLDEVTEQEMTREAFGIVSGEMQRLREVNRWQEGACSELAADLAKMSTAPMGPSLAHIWCILRLLDTLLLLDLVKSQKPSLSVDFTWYKRIIRQGHLSKSEIEQLIELDGNLQLFLSSPWPVVSNLQRLLSSSTTEGSGALEFIVQLIVVASETLEGGRTLLASDRLMLLRVLPVLVVLAAGSEKEGEVLFKKRIKLERLLRLFRVGFLMFGAVSYCRVGF